MENSKCLFKGVACVFMPVRDLEKMQFKHAEYKAAGMKSGSPVPTIGLVQVHDYKPVEFPKNDFFVDIFFNYIVEDVDQVHTDLIQKGVEVTEIHSSLDSSFRYFSAWDIDGNSISIVNG